MINPLEEPGHSTRCIDPCILVIFGATGDLTEQKAGAGPLQSGPRRTSAIQFLLRRLCPPPQNP